METFSVMGAYFLLYGYSNDAKRYCGAGGSLAGARSVLVEGIPAHSTGRTRYFESPPLPFERKFSYTVRAAWIEDDQWVSQLRKVPVQAGRHGLLFTLP
jgi:uncharacterized protein (TIGR03000 family)